MDKQPEECPTGLQKIASRGPAEESRSFIRRSQDTPCQSDSPGSNRTPTQPHTSNHPLVSPSMYTGPTQRPLKRGGNVFSPTARTLKCVRP